MQPNHDLFWATAAQALLPSEPYPPMHEIYMAVVSALVGRPSCAPPYGRHHPAWRGGVHNDDGSGVQLIGGMPRDVLMHHLMPHLGSADLYAAMSVCHAWRAALCSVVRAATYSSQLQIDAPLQETRSVLSTISRLCAMDMPALCSVTLHGQNWTMMQPSGDPADTLTPAGIEQLTIDGLVGSTVDTGWQVRICGCFGVVDGVVLCNTIIMLIRR